jgi:hypothetical protein
MGSDQSGNVNRKVLCILPDVAEQLTELLNKPSEGVGKGEVVFDEEVLFPNGRRMAIQVVASLDPLKEPCWSQGVLFSSEGEELGHTDVGESILGEFHCWDGNDEYAVEVKPAVLVDYHFDIGNTAEGVIGLCAVVRAASRGQAVDKLAEHLCESEIPVSLPDAEDVGYCRIYLNGYNITVADIDSKEAVQEES